MDRELKKLEDHTLIQRFMAGQDDCFALLLKRYKSKVFTTIYLIAKDREIAEDIFQEVMIKVVKVIRDGKYNEKGKFLPWVTRIARNLAIDHFRKVQRGPTIQRESEEYDIFNYIQRLETSPEEKTIKEENSRYIREMIQRLPDKQREVLIMRTYSGLSFKEIADLTNVNINTALGRMRYALINLRKMIEDSQIFNTYETNVQRR